MFATNHVVSAYIGLLVILMTIYIYSTLQPSFRLDKLVTIETGLLGLLGKDDT